MIDACILEGDIIILKKVNDPQTEIKNGDMIAAWLSDRDEATLKRYSFTSGKVKLIPENPNYNPISVKREHLHVRGKVVYVLRQV